MESIKYAILGEGSQISTHQKREIIALTNYVFGYLILNNLTVLKV